MFKDGRVEGFVLQIAEKTYADYKLVATNRGGHSSAPRPDNAIYALAGALKSVEEYRFKPMINDATRAFFERIGEQDKAIYGELVRAWLANPDDRETADLLEAIDPGYTRTRCVATMLSGGHAPNALPQKAEANVNCRIFPGVRARRSAQQLQAIAGQDVTVDDRSTRPVAAPPSPLRADIIDAYKRARRTALPRCAAAAVDVGRRVRRRLHPRGRNSDLRRRRLLGLCRRKIRRARPRRESPDRRLPRSGAASGRRLMRDLAGR